MVKESVLIDNSITETRQFIKSLIPQIKGKIVKEDSRRIVWTYRFRIMETQSQLLYLTEDGTIINLE